MLKYGIILVVIFSFFFVNELYADNESASISIAYNGSGDIVYGSEAGYEFNVYSCVMGYTISSYKVKVTSNDDPDNPVEYIIHQETYGIKMLHLVKEEGHIQKQ